ncbi:MAG TPA: hypothetical protein VG034_14855 [Acidimicrobiia bacterium]|nr:hypothetical protein [Acidimicrobiia bacterium]
MNTARATIRESDDSFHPATDDPFWNESAWFNFNIPARALNGFVYVYHRPNMHYSVAGVGLWDPTGADTYDCVHYDFGDTLPLPPDAEMFDFTLANSMTMRCLQPLRQYHISFDRNGCQLELTWTGMMDPFPSGLGDFSTGHYDQSGRVCGTVAVEGSIYEVDCFSNRDHSWGPRPFVNRPKLDYTWAVASERSAFSILALGGDVPPSKGYLPTAANDPLRGTVEPIADGWYLRDGQLGSLVSGTTTVTDRGPDGRPLVIVVDGIDDLGRTLRAAGRAETWLRWPGYQMLTYWTGVRWTFDSITAWGELQDMFPDQDSRRIFRRHPAANAVRVGEKEATCR